VPSHSADPLRRGALGKCLTSLPSACGKIIPQSVNAHATLGQKSVPVGHLLAPLGQKSAPLGQNLPHWGGHSPHWGGRLGPLGAPRRPTGARPEVPLWQTPCPTVPDFLAQWALLGLLCPLGLVCQTLLTQNKQTFLFTQHTRARFFPHPLISLTAFEWVAPALRSHPASTHKQYVLPNRGGPQG
jgi:hypothetical protein